MTKDQIEAVLERVKTWPEDRQEQALQILLALEREAAEPYILTDEERADLDEGIAEADRGEFASNEEVAAVFNRYRR
jgi:predicted transcriptional regulator